MTLLESIQSKTYDRAQTKAHEQLSQWSDTHIKLQAKGLTEREIRRFKANLELNAKGIFR